MAWELHIYKVMKQTANQKGRETMINDWSKRVIQPVGTWQDHGMKILCWENAGSLRLARIRQRTAIDRNLRSIVSICRSIDAEKAAEVSGNIGAIAGAYLHRINRNGGL